jgi:hypothetical protein
LCQLTGDGKKQLYGFDISKINQVEKKAKTLKETEKILEYDCLVLEVINVSRDNKKGETMTRRFYFNREFFKIDYTYIKNYKRNSQALVYRKMKAACMRFTIIENGCEVNMTAESVEFKKLEDQQFRIHSLSN